MTDNKEIDLQVHIFLSGLKFGLNMLEKYIKERMANVPADDEEYDIIYQAKNGAHHIDHPSLQQITIDTKTAHFIADFFIENMEVIKRDSDHGLHDKIVAEVIKMESLLDAGSSRVQ